MLLLLVGGGLKVVDYPVKEVFYIGVGLGGDLLVELSLFLGEVLCHSAGFAEDFGLQVGFVADDVDFDILLAGLADEIDPLGDALGGVHVWVGGGVLARSKTTRARWASLR